MLVLPTKELGHGGHGKTPPLLLPPMKEPGPGGYGGGAPLLPTPTKELRPGVYARECKEFFFNLAMEESSETSAGSQPQIERGSGTPTIHESSNLRITTTLFNGQNYLSWSRSAILSLKERGKLGYVNGTITAPPVTDSGYGKWDIENSHVINRLVHSMVPSIGEGYLHLTTAKDIWDALADTYSLAKVIWHRYLISNGSSNVRPRMKRRSSSTLLALQDYGRHLITTRIGTQSVQLILLAIKSCPETSLQIDFPMRRINYFVTTVSVLDTPGRRHVGSLMGAGGIVGEAAALDNWVAEIMEEEGEAHAPITQR
ncbi:hypothetical protein Acr_23g0015780 [Actinidia rufa]|uniref:Retrotransposon Copia-like N-terminal domain-containing protein n=1 Tax=Actinidia rufa TaxID=165716 RepID=A0A7J0GQZ0_9ERIC|nr:hypothetical protein Acr_23g0015780 [Actinidia rufa]